MPAQNANASRQFWVSVAGTGFLVLAAFIAFFVQMANVASDLRTLTARVAMVEDRAKLGETQTIAIASNSVRTNENLKEVETQFCASDIVRNLMHANDMRIVAVLWQKIQGTDFPTDNAYYPMICNRAAGP